MECIEVCNIEIYAQIYIYDGKLVIQSNLKNLKCWGQDVLLGIISSSNYREVDLPKIIIINQLFLANISFWYIRSAVAQQ